MKARTSNAVLYGGIGLAFLGIAGIKPAYVYGTGDNVRITVTDKERITTSSGFGDSKTVGSNYRVYTQKGQDIEVFENTDSWLRLKFASSNLHGLLQKGETYDCTAYGWRVPLFSWYRNLVSCTPVAK